LIATPNVGDDDKFEFAYMVNLKAKLAPYGLVVNYENDRAGIDFGIHFYDVDGSRTPGPGTSRIWVQAKGKRAATLTPEDFAANASVSVRLNVQLLRYWYAFPEALYLVIYVESVDLFLAADIRELVDRELLTGHQVSWPSQETVTLHLPKESTLERSLGMMPRHRSMRIDGKAWRGRPLGHGYDPLRSELDRFDPPVFTAIVSRLLEAHDFQIERTTVFTPEANSPVVGHVGTLGLTYEWVLPMTTEFGFSAGTDFRTEGAPRSAQGMVMILVDPLGDQSPNRLGAGLSRFLDDGRGSGIDTLLYFGNEEQTPGSFGNWFRASEEVRCLPQFLGSLTFNVLTTTMVYLEFLDRLRWRYVNYL